MGDLDTIKYRTPLISSASFTWFAVYAELLTDVYGNAVQEIETTNARQVDNFSLDTTPPGLTKFKIDMNSGVIDLSWDESIKFSSIDVYQLTLQTHERRAFSFHTNLQACAIGDCNDAVISDVDGNSRYIKITLSGDTLAHLKNYGICKTIFSCYISFTDTFVSDSFDNYAIPIWD